MKITGPVNGLPKSGTEAYVRNAEHSAWRKEMLAQVLEQVREAQPRIAESERLPATKTPPKGSVINVYI